MSVRAYRVNTKEFEKNPTFNLWRNNRLAHFLGAEFEDGYGDVEVEVEKMEEAVKILKNNPKELLDDVENEKQIKEDAQYLIKGLERDIKWAKKKGDTYIDYYCY